LVYTDGQCGTWVDSKPSELHGKFKSAKRKSSLFKDPPPLRSCHGFWDPKLMQPHATPPMLLAILGPICGFTTSCPNSWSGHKTTPQPFFRHFGLLGVFNLFFLGAGFINPLGVYHRWVVFWGGWIYGPPPYEPGTRVAEDRLPYVYMLCCRTSL
jgi:hypothetical protein